MCVAFQGQDWTKQELDKQPQFEKQYIKAHKEP